MIALLVIVGVLFWGCVLALALALACGQAAAEATLWWQATEGSRTSWAYRLGRRLGRLGRL